MWGMNKIYTTIEQNKFVKRANDNNYIRLITPRYT